MCQRRSGNALSRPGGSTSWEGKSAESETYWREALRLWPDDIDVLNELGLAIWRQGRAAEAEPIYRRAYQIKPDDYRILSNLGLAIYDQGRIDEAGEYYRRAIEIEPDAFDALMNLGLVLSDQGKFDEAKDVSRRRVQTPAQLGAGISKLRNQPRPPGTVARGDRRIRARPSARARFPPAAHESCIRFALSRRLRARLAGA